MDRYVAKISKVKPPVELAKFFAHAPLVGDESREDYDTLFDAIAVAAKPADAIAWLFVRDIADLSWEIQRERNQKLQVIKMAQVGEVMEALDVEPGSLKVYKEIREWVRDPKASRRIDKALADHGYDPTKILSLALGDDDIDAIDRRIESFEKRRLAILEAIAKYDELLARRLKAASSAIIDGEFSEAVE
jgi:hypothetical protein